MNAVVTFSHRCDDFKTCTYPIGGEEKRLVILTLTCTDTISISVHAIVDNPAEAKLLEEFKAMCRKTVKFTYYEREPNWFSKLAKIAELIK